MLRSLTLDDLGIEDERSFSHVGLYDELKQRLRRDGYRFRAPAPGRELSWDRALFYNLTFWQAGDQGDVLVADRVPADVVVHVGWHHVARAALGEAAASADGMFLGEAIASASDLYLVGRLLGHATEAEFLATQVPAMSDAGRGRGPSARRLRKAARRDLRGARARLRRPSGPLVRRGDGARPLRIGGRRLRGTRGPRRPSVRKAPPPLRALELDPRRQVERSPRSQPRRPRHRRNPPHHPRSHRLVDEALDRRRLTSQTPPGRRPTTSRQQPNTPAAQAFRRSRRGLGGGAPIANNAEPPS